MLFDAVLENAPQEDESSLESLPSTSAPPSTSNRTPQTSPPSSVSYQTFSPSSSSQRTHRPSKPISRFSFDNPFFGYPVVEPSPSSSPPLPVLEPVPSASHTDGTLAHETPDAYFHAVRPGPPSKVPKLRHGRQRKRDLFLALCILYWQRWKRHGALAAAVYVFYILHRSRAKFVYEARSLGLQYLRPRELESKLSALVAATTKTALERAKIVGEAKSLWLHYLHRRKFSSMLSGLPAATRKTIFCTYFP